MLAAASLLALVGAATVSADCSGSLGSGTAAAGDAFWYETITHQGTAPFASASNYSVYRNVKDYGAAGDGTTDDTAAIQAAIADGDRCGDGCTEDTTTPAVVYFPQGTYLVSAPIISYYYTTLLGDAGTPPTLLASASLTNNGTGYDAVIDADPYIPGGNGANYWTNQNNFFRSVRNFIIDVTAIPASTQGIGIHWQVAQATSLQNIQIKLSSDSGTQHLGVHMENGSGGFMSDVSVDGGLAGFNLGNQQFTFRNLVSTNAVNGIQLNWNWGMTFLNTTVSGCTNAFNLTTGGTTLEDQTAAATYLVDSSASSCTNFVSMSTDPSSTLAGSLIIDNAVLDTVPTAVSAAGTSLLTGGSTTVDLWGLGSMYSADGTRTYSAGAALDSYTKPSGLVDSSGKVFGKSRPQYETYAASQFASVKDAGAAGDGTTDDTSAIQTFINNNYCSSILFFDAGQYLVTDTISVPVGSHIVGEFFPVILASGDSFSDASNPKVVVQVGSAGDTGEVEISSMMFSAVGGSSGAIMMEWNVAGDAGAVGMWDSHFRLGGAKGTNINVANCANTTSPAVGGDCDAAFMGLHVTSGSSAYFENMWVWAADHDLEDPNQSQIDSYSSRGILHEATAASWYMGTAAEHHELYQYNFNAAQNVWIAVAQTESPYYQPNPAPTTVSSSFQGDPSFPSDLTSAWGVVVNGSSDMIFASAGLYSFFSDYDKACENSYDCQSQIMNVAGSSTGIRIYNLNTVATTEQLSVDSAGIIAQSDNRNGFASTATFWSSDSGNSTSSSRLLRRTVPRSTRTTRARRLPSSHF